MYKNILIATDGSELAAKGVAQGLAVAKSMGASVTIVTVTEPWTTVVSGEMAMAFPIEEYEQASAENAKKILDAAAGEAQKAGVTSTTVHVKDQFPAEGIIETAKDKGCDLIVMASHGRRGLQRMILGSQATNVLTHSTIPVLVIR
ncbi:MAG: hypothetical protein RLZ98_716 [Pseudomonadota bacterium]|jgi:nucleotide-binding universal stress UspA family protein